ncbi:MAG TPA: ATP-binding protein [Longimicrobiales bacterium]
MHGADSPGPPDLAALCQTVIERSPLALALTEGETHRLRCANNAFCRLTGTAAEPLLGRDFAEAFPDSKTDGSLALLDRVWRTGEAERMTEVAHDRPDGTTVFWCYTVWPVLGEARRPTALLIEVDDATERVADRRAQEEASNRMREINERLLVASVREQEFAERAELHSAEMDALLESLNDGAAIIAADGRITLLNGAAREITGVRAEVGAGAEEEYARIAFRRLDGTPLPPHERPIARALRGERFSEAEFLVVRGDGSRVRVSVSGSAIRDGTGRVTFAIIVFRDVTALRELEELKDQFIALISHDLRSPLNAILGFAQLLRGSLLKERGKPEFRHASAIMRAAEQMAAMIQDLLESTRLESGQIEMHKRPCNLGDQVMETVRHLNAEDQARVRIDAPPHLPRVAADPHRLGRAITNLITNALKYSPPETPVRVRITPRPDEVVVSVTDRGGGIPPEDLPYLFERFYRAKKHSKTEGLGLGLYITRLIIEAHGGRIWVESEPGTGSTFSFALPTERANGRASPPGPAVGPGARAEDPVI